MCKIFGISYGGENEKLSTGQMAAIMGVKLVDGGPHAFGWMQNVNQRVIVRKFEGRIDEHIEKLFSIKRECNWFVGHVRYATHGDSSNHNNIHPIQHDNIVGVHNGVLINHEDVLKKCGGRMNDCTEVDSEAIMAAVEHFGHKDGLAKIQGSMVAVYTDLRKSFNLYIARSNGRSLRMGWTKRENLIFASDQHALDALVSAGVEFENFSEISKNRCLKIVAGKIVDRMTYRENGYQFPAMRAAQNARRLSNTTDDPSVARLMAQYDALVALRRGESMFPSGRRRTPSERVEQWHRDHHNENTKPTKKPKRRIAQEVGVPVGENQIKYKGKIISLDEYLSLRSSELSEAIIAPEEDWQ